MWHRGLARSSWTMRHRETSDQACKGSLHSQRQTFPCQQQRGLSNRFCAAPLLQSQRRTGGHLRGNGLWEAVKRCNCVKVRWKRTEQNDPQPEGILWWEITKEKARRLKSLLSLLNVWRHRNIGGFINLSKWRHSVSPTADPQYCQNKPQYPNQCVVWVKFDNTSAV